MCNLLRRFAPLALLALCAAPLLRAQDQDEKPADEVPADIARMIKEGMADALETKVSGRKPDELHWLGQAYANKARKGRTETERKTAWEKAEDNYKKWVALLEKPGGDFKVVVASGLAHLDYGNMLLQRSGPAWDEYELTNGHSGDAENVRKAKVDALRKILVDAREQYEKANTTLGPMGENGASEDDLTAAGLFKKVVESKLDVRMNLGWTNYYIGMLETKDRNKRTEALRAAEKNFQELVDAGQTGQALFQCYLGLGMAQRELDKSDDAAKNFARAMDATAEGGTRWQARYELGRQHIRTAKYEEARDTLRPMAEKDLKNLSNDEKQGRFYIALAKLWDANSYLVEAESVRKEAQTSPAGAAALRLRAQRLREQGLTALGQLRTMGGKWPGLVRVYIASSVDMNADPKTLSPEELFSTAGLLLEAKDYVRAKDRLLEASKRGDIDENLAGDILFQLGETFKKMGDSRAAAEAYSRLSTERKSHEQAEAAALQASGLWAKISKETKKKEDYARLADALLNALQNYPNIPRRDEMSWWLPVALQSAGRYHDAGEQFANVPKESLNWEEAQFRRALCARLEIEEQRPESPTPEYTAKAEAAANGLLKYSDEAAQRAPGSASKDELLKWSAQARLAAAELLASGSVAQYDKAIDLTKDFESKYAAQTQELIGRLLGMRIRAYRGLKKFEDASKIVREYLKSVPAEKAGPVLAGLAKSMQDEVQRLADDGKLNDARKLAEESLETFKVLEDWIAEDAGRANFAEVVLAGRGEMLYMAGKYDDANQVVAKLLEKAPKNGFYQRLMARVLTAQLGENPTADQLKNAKAAWVPLANPALKKNEKSVAQYWEGRYNWLVIHAKEGNEAEVAKAIQQDHVWTPDLGGTLWQEKFVELYKRTAPKAGLPEDLSAAAETQPAPEAGGEGAESAANVKGND